MKLLKYVKFMVFITALALGYVHMQMRIFDMAYQGKAKEKAIRNLIDENGSLTYSILTLKSSSNLGVRLLEDNTDMQFVDPEDIVTLSTSDEALDNALANNSNPITDSSGALFKFISFGARAEAQVRK